MPSLVPYPIYPIHTMQRVVFEHGHCLLPRQDRVENYMFMLDDEVRAIAGKFICVYDTCTLDGSNGVAEPEMTLRMENICGSFPGSFENVPSAGALLQPGAPRVGEYVKNRKFIGTHLLFHTIHARLAYRVKQKTWIFKGCRSLSDLVTFVRDLTEDTESDIYPVVSMLSVTLRTDTCLVIDPAHSLMQRVLEQLYSNVVKVHPRCDDTNNLFFIDVINWTQLIKTIQKDRPTDTNYQSDDAVDNVQKYIASMNDESAHPNASIGYTRKGIFFIRITFPRGCVCSVEQSVGVVNGESASTLMKNICSGGVEPFVQVVVRFIVVVLVKMRVVGVN